jgi:hypothetical protein
MDHTSFDYYTLMVVSMAIAIYWIPKTAPRVSRLALIVGFIPSLGMMAWGAQLASSGGRPWNLYAAGLVAMFFTPMITVVLAEGIRRRRARARGQR